MPVDVGAVVGMVGKAVQVYESSTSTSSETGNYVNVVPRDSSLSVSAPFPPGSFTLPAPVGRGLNTRLGEFSTFVYKADVPPFSGSIRVQFRWYYGGMLFSAHHAKTLCLPQNLLVDAKFDGLPAQHAKIEAKFGDPMTIIYQREFETSVWPSLSASLMALGQPTEFDAPILVAIPVRVSMKLDMGLIPFNVETQAFDYLVCGDGLIRSV